MIDISASPVRQPRPYQEAVSSTRQRVLHEGQADFSSSTINRSDRTAPLSIGLCWSRSHDERGKDLQEQQTCSHCKPGLIPVTRGYDFALHNSAGTVSTVL